MTQKEPRQQIITQFNQDTYLLSWIEAFLIDQKARGHTGIRFYREKLAQFARYCEGQALTQIDQITPNFIRQFLLYLQERGNNPGGVHTFYRSIKAFLYWYEAEAEPVNWKNPIRKVKAPRVDIPPLEPADLDNLTRILSICKGDTFTAGRDYALFLFLLDTGVRASEFLSLNFEDIDSISGAVLIRTSKSRKPRTVFLGRKARKALRVYLRHLQAGGPLWVTAEGERLSYAGLRSIITRRAKQAGVKAPSPHSFRRAFALQCLRNGMDVYSLQRLMGHGDLQVLRRYLAQTNQDLQEAHAKGSPVEHAL